MCILLTYEISQTIIFKPKRSLTQTAKSELVILIKTMLNPDYKLRPKWQNAEGSHKDVNCLNAAGKSTPRVANTNTLIVKL